MTDRTKQIAKGAKQGKAIAIHLQCTIFISLMVMQKFVYCFLIVLFLGACGSVSKNGNRSGDKKFSAPKKAEIENIVRKVADWQIANLSYSTTGNLHDNGINAWTHATFYLGLSEWAKTDTKRKDYYEWLNEIGSESNWALAANFINHPKYQKYHADEFCMGQLYLNMYGVHKDEKMLQSTKERVDWVMSNPPAPEMKSDNKQSWTWCDALFMAPPVYAHLASVENDDNYLHFMDIEFKKTYEHLYDKKSKLFFRDASYFEQREKNGEKIFWGRGNGWVAAGLVNILKLLPSDSEYTKFYEDLYKEFIPRLAKLQSKDGFWHASLLDPESYPSPETSATALITYAIMYGVNRNLLDHDIYYPIVEKSWNALQSVVSENGKLGWVQPIGADPKKVTAEMTASYGVGAFLLAGNEIYNMKN